MPALNRNIATIAAAERSRAQGSTLASSGASNDDPRLPTCQVSRKTVWMANQIAGFKQTPTTAAVIADKAPCKALLPRRASMKGAPRKMNRKHGTKVTQV